MEDKEYELQPIANSIAVVTANVGNFDTNKEIPPQTIQHGFYRVTKNTSSGSDRLFAKYPKICPHYLFTDKPDTYIWIDGSVQVKSPNFVEYMCDMLQGHDVAIGVHPDRNCAYDEIDYILNQIYSGNTYLRSRYKKSDLIITKRRLQDMQHPKNIGLYACGIFARKNTTKVNAAFAEWWQMVMNFDTVDQPSFSAIANKHGLSINPIVWDTLCDNQYFKLIPHGK